MHDFSKERMHTVRCCEVSWEVCNKVGGIYTVLATKAQRMVEQYGDGYFAIGPYAKQKGFDEQTPNTQLSAAFEQLRKEGIICHYGTWHVPGIPQTILIDVTQFAQHTNGIKRYLWDTYQIDTLGTQWHDVDAPLVWSWAAGKLVELLKADVCHCHEWLAAGALLYLRAHHVTIGTVFTTHATTLGRALASEGILYDVLEHVNADAEAAKRGISVKAKHAIEKVAAREAHVFTTVSEITGMEAEHILSRTPDVLLPNGLDLARFPNFSSILKTHARANERMLAFLHERFSMPFSHEKTRILFLSGREEVHDKGMDVFIDALRQLELQLADTDLTVAVFFWVPANVKGTLARGPCTHELDPSDPLLQRLMHAGLLNSTHVKVVYYPVYLSPEDGLLNLTYDEAQQGTHLGVFPSYYEPWGYTPLEAAAYGVPSITTDLAGFGRFIQTHLGRKNPGVFVLPRWKKTDAEASVALAKLLHSYVTLSSRERAENQSAAHALAAHADWKQFVHAYLDAERRAMARSIK